MPNVPMTNEPTPEKERRLPLSQRQEIIDAFHRLSYDEARRGKTWHATTYRGVKVNKLPSDLWLYHQLIHDRQPRTIIECGTAQGGSALYLGDELEALGRGQVFSIDIQERVPAFKHPRVKWLVGSSLAWAPDGVPGPVMVILDSDHSQEHVAKELEHYAGVVTVGQYLVVEDSDIGGHPVHAGYGPGPWEAVQEWLPNHPEYREDRTLADRFLFSSHTWLRKVA